MVKNSLDIPFPPKSARTLSSVKKQEQHERNSSTLHPGVEGARVRRKSPITVQEWVAALPPPHTNQRGLALETQQQQERVARKRSLEVEEDEYDEEDDEVTSISLKAEENLDYLKDSKSFHIEDGISGHEEDSLVLEAEGQLSSKEKDLNPISLDSRRRYLKESRELYPSFRSDMSMKSLSSIDCTALISSRELNPSDMLMELGFGVPVLSNLARIPRRFLKDSVAKGISLRNFLSIQEEVLDYS